MTFMTRRQLLPKRLLHRQHIQQQHCVGQQHRQHQQQHIWGQSPPQHMSRPPMQLCVERIGGSQWIPRSALLQQRQRRVVQNSVDVDNAKLTRQPVALQLRQQAAAHQGDLQRRFLTWRRTVNDQQHAPSQHHNSSQSQPPSQRRIVGQTTLRRGFCGLRENDNDVAAAVARIREQQADMEAQAAAIVFPPGVIAEAQGELMRLGAAAVLTSSHTTAARRSNATEAIGNPFSSLQQALCWGRRLSATGLSIVRRVAASAATHPLPLTTTVYLSTGLAGVSSKPTVLGTDEKAPCSHLLASLYPPRPVVAGSDTAGCQGRKVSPLSAFREADASNAEAAAVSALLPGLLSLLCQVAEVAAMVEVVEMRPFIVMLQQQLKRPALWAGMTDDELAMTANALEQLGTTNAWIADAAARTLLHSDRYLRMDLSSVIKASKVLVLQKSDQHQWERQAGLTARQEAAKQLQRLLLQRLQQAMQQQQLVQAVFAAGRLGLLSHVAANQALSACRNLAAHAAATAVQLHYEHVQRRQSQHRWFSEHQLPEQHPQHSFRQKDQLKLQQQQQRKEKENEILATTLLPDEELLQLPAAFAAAGLSDEYLFLWAAEQLLLRLGGPSLQQLHLLIQQQQQTRQQGTWQRRVRLPAYSSRIYTPAQATTSRRKAAELILLRLALLHRVGPTGMQQAALPLFCRCVRHLPDKDARRAEQDIQRHLRLNEHCYRQHTQYLMPALPHMQLEALVPLLDAAAAVSRQLPHVQQKASCAVAAAMTPRLPREEQQLLLRSQQEALQLLSAGCLSLLLLEGALKRLDMQRLFRLLDFAAFFLKQRYLWHQRYLQRGLSSPCDTPELNATLANGLCHLYAHLQQHMRLTATSRSQARIAAAALLRGMSPHIEQQCHSNQLLKNRHTYAASSKTGIAKAEHTTAPQIEAGVAEAAQGSAYGHSADRRMCDSEVAVSAIKEGPLDAKLFGGQLPSADGRCAAAQGPWGGCGGAPRAFGIPASHQRLVMDAAKSMLAAAALHGKRDDIYSFSRPERERLFSFCNSPSQSSSVEQSVGAGDVMSSTSVSEAVQALTSISVNISLLPSLAPLSLFGATASFEGELAAADTSATVAVSGSTQHHSPLCSSARNGAGGNVSSVVGVRVLNSPESCQATASAAATATGTITTATDSDVSKRPLCSQQQQTPRLLSILCELLPVVTRVCCCGQVPEVRGARATESTAPLFRHSSKNAAALNRSHYIIEPTAAEVNAATTACVRLLLTFIPSFKPLFSVISSSHQLLHRLVAPNNPALSCDNSCATLPFPVSRAHTRLSKAFSQSLREGSKAGAPAKPPPRSCVCASTPAKPVVPHDSAGEADSRASTTSTTEMKLVGDGRAVVVKKADNLASSLNQELPPAAAAALSCCSLLLLQLLLLIPNQHMNADASAYSLRGLLACVHRTPEELLPALLLATRHLPSTHFTQRLNETATASNKENTLESTSQSSHSCNESQHCPGVRGSQPVGNRAHCFLSNRDGIWQDAAKTDNTVVTHENSSVRRAAMQTTDVSYYSASHALAAPVALLLDRLCAAASVTHFPRADHVGIVCDFEEQQVDMRQSVPIKGTAHVDAAATHGRVQALDCGAGVSAPSQIRTSFFMRINAVGPCLAAAGWLQQHHFMVSAALRPHLQKLTSYRAALVEDAHRLLPLLPPRELRLLRLQLQDTPSAFRQDVLSRIDGVQQCR